MKFALSKKFLIKLKGPRVVILNKVSKKELKKIGIIKMINSL